MSGPQANLLDQGERLHLHHGPIDLIIGAETRAPEERNDAFRAASARFGSILTELTGELDLLRAPVSEHSDAPAGSVAGRMHAAVMQHRACGFVTPMAAVAGAVADEVLYAMAGTVPMTRAYVNNGGDIALYLSDDQSYSAGVATPDGTWLGTLKIPARSGIRGIATSGFGGRSQTFGIADSVTVLAATAAEADVAATLIANAVTLPDHPAIRREPASERHPDSDLGNRKIVTYVGPLSKTDIALALDRGLAVAYGMKQSGRIAGVCLSLRGQTRVLGRIPLVAAATSERRAHAAG